MKSIKLGFDDEVLNDTEDESLETFDSVDWRLVVVLCSISITLLDVVG